MPTLEEIKPKEWEDLISYYIKTTAVLECRIIFRDEKKETFTLAIPETELSEYKKLQGDNALFFTPKEEFYGFLIAKKWKNKTQKISTIAGMLIRYKSNGETNNCGEFFAEWDENFYSWIIPCENETEYQILPGNVLNATIPDKDIQSNSIPRLFEINRPDAPKDEVHRKFILPSSKNK